MTSIDDAHAALLRNRQLQFDLQPAPPKPPPPKPWTWGAGTIDVTVLWVLVGILALAVLLIVVRYLKRNAGSFRSEPKGRPVAEPVEIPLDAAHLALGDADGLAAGGRFTDAAHVLLACGVDEIARRYPTMLRPAFTSRDIVAITGLPASMRQAFGRIAASVEVGLFGGRPIGADDYAACRQAFVTSALAGRI